MPAVQLDRLQKQIAALRPLLEEPRRFVARLRDLLAFYSDPARRVHFSNNPAPLLSAYHVPPQVTRILTRRLTAWVQDSLQDGLPLCAALWETRVLECRQIAAGVLGGLPVRDPAPLWARLETWLSETPEIPFQEQILSLGGVRLRREQPEAYRRWLEARLHSRDETTRLQGMIALRLWLQDDFFENYPLAFRWLRLLGNDLPAALRPDYLAMLKILAQRSPGETVAFLQELHLRYDTPQMRAMVHRARQALPPAWRE